MSNGVIHEECEAHDKRPKTSEVVHVPDLSVLKEYEVQPMKRRRWVLIYEDPEVEHEFLRFLFPSGIARFIVPYLVTSIVMYIFAIYNRWDRAEDAAIRIVMLLACILALSLELIFGRKHRNSFADDFKTHRFLVAVRETAVILGFILLVFLYSLLAYIGRDFCYANKTLDSTCRSMVDPFNIGFLALIVAAEKPRCIFVQAVSPLSIIAEVVGRFYNPVDTVEDFVIAMIIVTLSFAFLNLMRYLLERIQRDQFEAFVQLQISSERLRESFEAVQFFVDNIIPAPLKPKLLSGKFCWDTSHSATCTVIDFYEFHSVFYSMLPRDASILVSKVQQLFAEGCLRNGKVHKVAAMGDTFYGVCNLLTPCKHPDVESVRFALAATGTAMTVLEPHDAGLRVGIGTGAITGAVVSSLYVRYDIFGVVVAEVLEMLPFCRKNDILVSAATKERICGFGVECGAIEGGACWKVYDVPSRKASVVSDSSTDYVESSREMSFPGLIASFSDFAESLSFVVNNELCEQVTPRGHRHSPQEGDDRRLMTLSQPLMDEARFMGQEFFGSLQHTAACMFALFLTCYCVIFAGAITRPSLGFDSESIAALCFLVVASVAFLAALLRALSLRRLYTMSDPPPPWSVFTLAAVVISAIVVLHFSSAMTEPNVAANGPAWFFVLALFSVSHLPISPLAIKIAMFFLYVEYLVMVFSTRIPVRLTGIIAIACVSCFLSVIHHVKHQRNKYFFVVAQKLNEVKTRLAAQEEKRIRILSATLPQPISQIVMLNRFSDKIITFQHDMVLLMLKFNTVLTGSVRQMCAPAFSSGCRHGSDHISDIIQRANSSIGMLEEALVDTGNNLFVAKIFCDRILVVGGLESMSSRALGHREQNLVKEKLLKLCLLDAVAVVQRTHWKSADLFTAVLVQETTVGIITNGLYPTFDVLGPSVTVAASIIGAAPPGSKVGLEKTLRLVHDSLPENVTVGETETWKIRERGKVQVRSLRFLESSPGAQRARNNPSL